MSEVAEVFPEVRLNQRTIALLAGNRSTEWACDAIRRGEFGARFSKDGQDYLVPVSDVNAWFASRRITPANAVKVRPLAPRRERKAA